MSNLTLGYSPALDGLRGVSILAVLGLRAGILSGGFLGVDIFFVLSGFLITTLLLQEQRRYDRIDLKSFYIRHALRLLPALYAVLLVPLTYGDFFAPADITEQINYGSVATFFYVSHWWQAFYGTSSISILTHTWSLAADSILTGCLIAVLFQNNTLKFSRRCSTLFGLLGVVILAPLFVFASSKGSFWHIICFKVANQVTMRWAGSIILIVAAKFALTLLVASVSFYWLERPCLRLKDRLGRRHSTPPPILEAQAI